jgi:hypothetical protein
MLYLIKGKCVKASNEKEARIIAEKTKTIKIDIGADLFDEYRTTLFNVKYFSERICEDISDNGKYKCKVVSYDLDKEYLSIDISTDVKDEEIKKCVENMFAYHTKACNMSFFKNGEGIFYGYVDSIPKITIQ